MKMLNPAAYSHWQCVARQHARRAADADDLLHDALLALRAAGRTIDSADDRKWFVGTIRNLAAMQARSAARRRRWESAAGVDPASPGPSSPDSDLRIVQPVSRWLATIDKLPRSLRQVAVLAINGLNRDELRTLLNLSDAALRRRIADLRLALGPMLDGAAPTLPSHPSIAAHLEIGVLRRSLLAVLLDHAGEIGTHDPDGHLLVISRKTPSQNSPGRQ